MPPIRGTRDPLHGLSEPVPVLHKIGIRPEHDCRDGFITFGRTLSTAPSIMASYRSVVVNFTGFAPDTA